MKHILFVMLAAIAVASAAAPPVDNGAACTACKTVIGIIETWLQDGKTVAEIKVLVHDMCAIMGPTYSAICSSLLEGNIEKIIKWIIAKEPPLKVCQQLKICPLTALPEPEPNTAKCDFCVLIVDALEYFIQDPRTEQEIIHRLEWICKKLIPKYVTICNELMAYGVMELVELIKKHGDPHVVCNKVGKMCPAPQNLEAAKCDFCILAVDALEYFIKDPRTEQEIIHHLERVCKWFPKHVAMCDQIIEYGVMEFVELIKKYGDAHTVCHFMKLC